MKSFALSKIISIIVRWKINLLQHKHMVGFSQLNYWSRKQISSKDFSKRQNFVLSVTLYILNITQNLLIITINKLLWYPIMYHNFLHRYIRFITRSIKKVDNSNYLIIIFVLYIFDEQLIMNVYQNDWLTISHYSGF